MPTRLNLGVVEGFYGKPWSFETRGLIAPILKRLGYNLYYYAPKADPFFRRKWREPIPKEHADQLSLMICRMHEQKIEVGIGLSPFEAYLNYDQAVRDCLKERIQTILDLGFDRIAILFDDMKGGTPNLAQLQAEMIHDVFSFSGEAPIAMCPTYYSLDPILDQLFGERPSTYLSDLGRELPLETEILWTGEKICSAGYTQNHLRWVAEQFGRFPLLWDNYPVNDGPKMCPFLHLGPVTNRHSSISHYISGHLANPMNQMWLSLIPLGTLRASYALGDEYSPEENFLAIATQLFGSTFANYLKEDLSSFQEKGLNSLSPSELATLKDRYSGLINTRAKPAVQEILDWLDHRYEVTREVFLTQ